MFELTSAPLGFAPLAGASGYLLLLGLCALLFIEECGVPLLFAPGDAILLVCGIMASAGQINAIEAFAAISAAVIVGAMVGREIFQRAGSALVNRIAGFLRLQAALDRISEALRRRGSLGVFIGRLTPGLRVHTTEAAGIIGMPRRTFAIGLVPAAIVYEAIFFGLGFWLGPAATSAIHQYTPRPAPLIVMAAAVVGIVVTVRWIVARVRFGAWTATR
jgi:membrane protein DedA with SNARE-associated domain